MSDYAAISAQLAELQRSMGRVEEAVKPVRDLERRIRKLELWRSWIAGGVAALGALFTWQFKGHL